MNNATFTGQVIKFLAIGGGVSFLYFAIALLFDRVIGFRPVAASTIAYAIAAVFSFFGHKIFTFNTKGRSKSEVLRFSVSTLIGFSLAFFIPYLLAQFSSIISYLAVLTLVPVLSFLMLKFFVFQKN